MRFYRKNRHLIKRLIWLSIPIFIYGLVKLALWYSAYDTLNRINQNYSGLLKLSYKTISSSIKGQIHVHKLTIFIPMTGESIHIKKISLAGNNVYSLLTLGSQIESGKIPSYLSLYLQELSIAVDSSLLTWQSALSNQNARPSLFTQFHTLACGKTKKFDAKVLKEMEYISFVNDLSLKLQYDQLKRSILVDLRHDIASFFSYESSMVFNNMRRLPPLTELLAGNLPQPEHLTFRFIDNGFVPRKITYCARQNQSSRDEYIAKHLRLARDFLQKAGILVNDPIHKAYATFLKFPDSIFISLDLSAIDVSQTNPVDLEDLLQKLKPQLKVNDKEVMPLSVKIDGSSLKQHTDGKVPIEIHDPQAKPKHVKKYRHVSVEQLTSFPMHQVIITTLEGKKYQGQLRKAGRDEFEISVRKMGGVISYYIKASQISSAQVYY